MIDQLLEQFLASPDADEARAALRDQHGLSNTTAQDSLAETARALHATTASSPAPLMGHEGGLLGALAGLIPGLGGSGPLSTNTTGTGGPLAGRAGDMIARRTGLDPRTAAIIAATAIPFLLRFLKNRAGASAAPQQPGVMPPSRGPAGVMPPPQPQPPMATPQAREKAPMAPDAKTEKRAGSDSAERPVAPWKRML